MVPRETGRREFLFGSGAGVAASAGAGRSASGFDAPVFGIPDLHADHRLRWQTDVSSEEALVYPMTAGDGAVFAFVYRTGSQSGSDYAVYAFDAETGEARWTKEAIRPTETPPSNGLVYGYGQREAQALDTADGSVAWQFQTDGEETRVHEFTVTDGIAVAVTERELVALDAGDGSEQWRFSLERDDEQDETHRRPNRVRGLTVTDDSLYFGSSEGFTALALADGRERWHVRIDEHVAWAAAVRDGLLVGWSNRAVYGIETTGGTRRFRTPVENVRTHDIGGTVGDRTAYVWGKGLTAVDLQSGGKRWTYVPDDTGTSEDDRPGFSPVVGEGRVYTSTGEQSVVALDAESGREQWQFDADTGFGPWGTVAGGYVYVTGKRRVHAFDAETGREEWSLDGEPEQNNFWVSALGDSVFVGTRSGRLYAIDPPSRFADAPVETAARFATSSPGLGLLGLLGAGLLGVGYRRAKRRASAGSLGDADLEFGRLELLGRGPVTETHLKRVRTPDGPRLVAETRLTDDGNTDDEIRHRFTEAVEKWVELDAKGIAGILPVRNHGTDPAPWFQTPYLAGGSLADSWPLTYRERVEVVSAVARTLHAAHREEVAHGRLTPRHVFRDAAGEQSRREAGGPEVRVGGWFLADALAEVREDADPYAPPESRNRTAKSVRGDVYRLGALARHLLAGELPTADSDSEAESSGHALPSELRSVLDRALAADQEEGYDSALAFDDEFRWAALDR
jgi:outer membrane protein assembly factor BamB